jgi:creatinine amidohydrolase
MLLHLQTWSEVEDYLKRSAGIIVPIGSTEQHGPNGLIGTDAICAEVIARGVGESVTAMVGPTINVGMAQHHLAFPGSITLRPTTLIAFIRDYVASLARNGFRKFYFLNGHGGNTAPLSTAFSEIYAEASLGGESSGTPIRCHVRNWWQTASVKSLAAELYGDREGSHATPSEVSVTQYAHPEAIKHRVLEAAASPSRPFADAADFRRLHPDGRMGSDPSLATPEHGARFVAAAVADISADYRRFLAEG